MNKLTPNLCLQLTLKTRPYETLRISDPGTADLPVGSTRGCIESGIAKLALASKGICLEGHATASQLFANKARSPQQPKQITSILEHSS